MDLNVRLKPSTQEKELSLTVKRMAEMGWSALAWNQTVIGKAGQKYQVKPRSEVLLTLPDIKHVMANRCLVRADPPSSGGSNATVDVLDLGLSGGKRPFPHLIQYNRVTVMVDDVIDANTLTSTNEALKVFDVVAATPGDAKVFAYLCKVADIDIIALDFTRRVPFPLNKKLVDAAVKRGIAFEIRYNPVFHSSAARREIFAGTRHLVKILRGKNIILTSGVETVSQIRGVHEAINVAKLMKMNAEQAVRATLQTCRDVIQHGIARKNRFLPLEVVTPEQFEAIYREYDESECGKKSKRNELADVDLMEMYNPSRKKRKDESDCEVEIARDEGNQIDHSKNVSCEKDSDEEEQEDDGFLKL